MSPTITTMILYHIQRLHDSILVFPDVMTLFLSILTFRPFACKFTLSTDHEVLSTGQLIQSSLGRRRAQLLKGVDVINLLMDDKNSSGDHIKRFVRVYKNKKEFFSFSEILLQLIYNKNWVSYTPTQHNTKLHVISHQISGSSTLSIIIKTTSVNLKPL